MSELLTKRLRAAYELFALSMSNYLIDVGTDHAYLPISLCLDGLCERATASDIGVGPLERATVNINSNNLDDRIKTQLCDGIPRTLENARTGDKTAVSILGMGGELIVSILSSAKKELLEGSVCILQPMTHPETVRQYLASKGYRIIDERIESEGRRTYQLILVETKESEPYSVTDTEAYFGAVNIARLDEKLPHLIRSRKASLQRAVGGKKLSSLDTAHEEAEIKELDELLNKFGGTGQ